MKGDLLGVVEAAYDLDAPPDDWLRELTARVGFLVDHGLGTYGAMVDASDPAALKLGPIHAYRGRPAMLRAFEHVSDGAEAHRVVRLYRSGAPWVSARRAVGPVDWRSIASRHGREEVGDCTAVCAIDTAGRGCVIMAPSERVQRVDARAERVWGRVTAHVIAMLRLRAAVDALPANRRKTERDGEAILSPAGDVVHAEGIARARSARSALREAALARERARGALRRRSPDEALDLWRALVEGRWSIVDRFERDGRRYLIAHENEPKGSGQRTLTRRENQVVSLVAMGRTNKLIAYELGLSVHAIGRYLTTAMRKLGFASRAEMARVRRAPWMSPPDELPR